MIKLHENFALRILILLNHPRLWITVKQVEQDGNQAVKIIEYILNNKLSS